MTQRNIFKYNMSYYYQSTIIYLVVFILYVVIRGSLEEGQFSLVIEDPIIYFFALIVIISIAAILFNLYKNRHIEITDSAIKFINRFRTKQIEFNNIKSIRMFRERNGDKAKAFRLVLIAVRNRHRPAIIRPYDYENEAELIEVLRDLKTKYSTH